MESGAKTPQAAVPLPLVHMHLHSHTKRLVLHVVGVADTAEPFMTALFLPAGRTPPTWDGEPSTREYPAACTVK